MAKLISIICEFISKGQLKAIERYADNLFKGLKIDITFTNHFFQRLNSARNKQPISADELIELFEKTFIKWGREIAMSPDLEAVIKDINSQINLPFTVQYNKNTKQLEFISKTIMRKKDFKTSNAELKV